MSGAQPSQAVHDASVAMGKAACLARMARTAVKTRAETTAVGTHLNDVNANPVSTLVLLDVEARDAARALAGIHVDHDGAIAEATNADAAGVTITEQGDGLLDDKDLIVGSGTHPDTIAGLGCVNRGIDSTEGTLQAATRVHDQLDTAHGRCDSL